MQDLWTINRNLIVVSERVSGNCSKIIIHLHRWISPKWEIQSSPTIWAPPNENEKHQTPQMTRLRPRNRWQHDTPADIPRILRVYITIPGFFRVVPSNHNTKPNSDSIHWFILPKGPMVTTSNIYCRLGTLGDHFILQLRKKAHRIKKMFLLKFWTNLLESKKWWELSWQVPCDVWKTLGNFPRFSPPIRTKFAIWLKKQNPFSFLWFHPFFVSKRFSETDSECQTPCVDWLQVDAMAAVELYLPIPQLEKKYIVPDTPLEK